VDIRVVGVADHHAGRLEAFGGHARKPRASSSARTAAQFDLLGAHLVEAVGAVSSITSRSAASASVGMVAW
jgi:hypothetical protein